jgi:hypothetical protein
MALKALCMDDESTPHLLIGLTRGNIESLLKGSVLVLPQGPNLPLVKDSQVILMFEETDEELIKRMSYNLPPATDKLI